MLDPIQLEPTIGTALLYPCCGNDLETPIRIFGTTVSDFYFVDIRQPRIPKAIRELAVQVGPLSPKFKEFRERESGNRYRVHRWIRRGEDAFADIPKLGVFFHRGDTLADGEGSSGIPWLGQQWLEVILGKLVPGGLIVTDGSNCPDNGPHQLKEFYCNSRIRQEAVSLASSFEFCGRQFKCIGYAGERYGPTLIWRIA